MKILWIGQGGLLFVVGNKKIMIDPYLTNSLCKINHTLNRKAKINKKLFEVKPDVLILTNSHPDHTDMETVIKLAKKGKSNLTILSAGSVFPLLTGNKHTMGCNNVMFEYGCEWSVEGAIIEATYAKSDDSTAFCVIITDTESGKKYFVAEDTLYSKYVLEDIPKDIYAAFIPINGEYGSMNILDAKRFALKINPCHTVPIHFGMFDDVSPEYFDVPNLVIPEIYHLIELTDKEPEPVCEDTEVKEEAVCEDTEVKDEPAFEAAPFVSNISDAENATDTPVEDNAPCNTDFEISQSSSTYEDDELVITPEEIPNFIDEPQAGDKEPDELELEEAEIERELLYEELDSYDEDEDFSFFDSNDDELSEIEAEIEKELFEEELSKSEQGEDFSFFDSEIDELSKEEAEIENELLYEEFSESEGDEFKEDSENTYNADGDEIEESIVEEAESDALENEDGVEADEFENDAITEDEAFDLENNADEDVIKEESAEEATEGEAIELPDASLVDDIQIFDDGVDAELNEIESSLSKIEDSIIFDDEELKDELEAIDDELLEDDEPLESDDVEFEPFENLDDLISNLDMEISENEPEKEEISEDDIAKEQDTSLEAEVKPSDTDFVECESPQAYTGKEQAEDDASLIDKYILDLELMERGESDGFSNE